MSEPAHRRLDPQEVDEHLYMELRVLADDAMLRARAPGDERCGSCRYYLEAAADLSYCWHPELRILVGSDWWCQWWDDDSTETG
jgi:hypothetical protein